MCENSLLQAPLSASCPQSAARELMDTHPLTKVLPFLYLGNSKDADDRDGMTANGITRVLNVTTSQQSPSPTMDHRTSGIVYKRLSVLDNGHANLKQYFEEAFEFIGELHYSTYFDLEKASEKTSAVKFYYKCPRTNGTLYYTLIYHNTFVR